MVKLSESSEANLTTAINNIQIGIEKLNRRETITEYTKPDSLVGIEFANGNAAYFNVTTKRCDQDIYLDVEWSTG